MSNTQNSSTTHDQPQINQLMLQHISKQDRLAEEVDVRKFAKAFGLETIQKKQNDIGKNSNTDKNQFQNEKLSEGLFTKAINAQFLETQIRAYVHTMVEPVLVLAKQNIEHNSKKNERFNDMNTKYEGVQRQIEDIKREVNQLSKLPKQLIQLETLVSSNSQGIKGQIESLDAVIRKLQNKIIEAESIREEMHKALEIRELKVSSLDENVAKLKEKITADGFEQQKKFNTRFDHLSEQIEKGRLETSALQNLIYRVKTLTEENEQSHLVVEYKIQTLQQQLEEFQRKGIDVLSERLDQNLDRLLQNSQQINDQTVQFRVLSDKNLQLDQKLIETQNFIAQTIPLLNYMQVSDALREFLCLSDQKRLIDYDNKMLSSLTQTSMSYFSLKNYCEQTAKQCLELGTGLGPFELGRSLDIDYIKQRTELINSHQKLYAHLHDRKKQYHIGCLNGTVLKEVKVIYMENRKLKQQSRRMRQNFGPQSNQVDDVTESESDAEDEAQPLTQEELKNQNLSQYEHNRRLSKLSSEAQSKYSKPSRPKSSNSNVKPTDTKRASTYSDNYSQPIKQQRKRTKTTMVGSSSKGNPKQNEKLTVPVEESKVNAILPQAKNAIVNKILIESSKMNVSIIKEHTTRLNELQARFNSLEEKVGQSTSDKNLFLHALTETSETKLKLDEQYDSIVKLMSQFKTKQEKQEKQAIEMLQNFMSKQTSGFDQFKRSIEIEYLEFFKSRQRIRADWSQHCKQVQIELEELVSLVENTASLAVKLSQNDQIISRQLMDLAEFLKSQNDCNTKSKGKLIQKTFEQLISDVKASLGNLFVQQNVMAVDRTTYENSSSIQENGEAKEKNQIGKQCKDVLFIKYSENTKDRLAVLKQQFTQSDRPDDSRKEIILPRVSVQIQSEQSDSFELKRIKQSIESFTTQQKRPITAKRQSNLVAIHRSISSDRPGTSNAERVNSEICKLYQTSTEKMSDSQAVLVPKDSGNVQLVVEVRKKFDRARSNKSIYVTGLINKKVNTSQLSTVNQDEEL